MTLSTLVAPLNDLHTVKDWIRWGASIFNRAELFFGHGTDNAWDEAAVLVLWAIAQPWERLGVISDCRLTDDEKNVITYLFNQRIELRVPAAYLTGEAWFAGLQFKVTPDVLVPRSPIAELLAVGFEPWLTVYPTKILDMCTGSGCIGIACAMYFEDAEVDLVDISPEALVVAQENIHKHSMSDRVRAIESDGFNALGNGGYDLIVSNPPYVDAADLASMPQEYHAEPELGLASGDDGLDFTRTMLEEASKRLNVGGLLVVEVGNSWEALEEAYPHISFLWPEFENGGHGVFVLTQEQLAEAFPKKLN